MDGLCKSPGIIIHLTCRLWCLLSFWQHCSHETDRFCFLLIVREVCVCVITSQSQHIPSMEQVRYTVIYCVFTPSAFVCCSADDKHLQGTVMSFMNEIIFCCNVQSEHEALQILLVDPLPPPPPICPPTVTSSEMMSLQQICYSLWIFNPDRRHRMSPTRGRGMWTARVRQTSTWPHSRSMRWPGVDCPRRDPFDCAPICPAINTK